MQSDYSVFLIPLVNWDCMCCHSNKFLWLNYSNKKNYFSDSPLNELQRIIKYLLDRKNPQNYSSINQTLKINSSIYLNRSCIKAGLYGAIFSFAKYVRKNKRSNFCELMHWFTLKRKNRYRCDVGVSTWP